MPHAVGSTRLFRTSTKARVRGKLYRDLAKIRERKLAAKVAAMRSHVHKLKLLRATTQLLLTSPTDARSRILALLFQCLKLQAGSGAATGDALSVTVIRASSQPSIQFPFQDELPFEVDTIAVEGAPEAPIVILKGQLQGRHTQRTIDRLYHNVPGSFEFMEKLLHRRVNYACRCMLFFEADGSLAHYNMETESLPQMLDALTGRLDLVPYVMRVCK